MPYSFQKRKVLIIEDNPGDAVLIHEMLKEADDKQYLGVVSPTLEDGESKLSSFLPDVILLDLTLPDSTGLPTLLHVRSIAHDVPIIVLTGLDDQNQLGVNAVKTGAQDYLVKDNIDGKLLRRSISYAIERQRIETALRRSQEEYRSLIEDVFETSSVAVIILDNSYSVVWCNEATETYFGIAREDLLGRDKRALISEKLKCIFEDQDGYEKHIFGAYENDTFSEYYECHVLATETVEERWLEHWSQPISAGMYAGGRIEQYTDITERKKLELNEQEARRYAEALRDIATLLTRSLDLTAVLDSILKNLHILIPHDSAAISIIEEGNLWVARRSAYDKIRDTQEIVAERQLQIEYVPFLQEMREKRQPIIIDDLQLHPPIAGTASIANVRSYIGAPISLQHELIGYINIFSQKSNFFSTKHTEQLESIAELAAIAIQNARLFARSQELATTQERQRLARDLHDSVSQTMFTCRTMAETALRRWDKDPVRARELLEAVHQLTMTALNEMRVLLLELRPDALTKVSIKQLFEQYLKPIEEREDFALQTDIQEIKELPADVQIAFYRIAQEALNNVTKHSQASNVTIRVHEAEGELHLYINDDGRGFAEKAVSATSLGLSIMKERAQEIGAEFNISTNIDVGTEITVSWNSEEYRQ